MRPWQRNEDLRTFTPALRSWTSPRQGASNPIPMKLGYEQESARGTRAMARKVPFSRTGGVKRQLVTGRGAASICCTMM